MRLYISILMGLSALLLLLTLAVLSGCTAAPQRPQSLNPRDEAAAQAYLAARIRDDMARHQVPGLSIALVDDQRVVWAQGFGEADLQQHSPASADTLYRVGSISKLFTDVAALQWVEAGRLRLDQPVREVLPGFGLQTLTPEAPITVRQLMTHHAGLPRDELKGFFNPDPQPLEGLGASLAPEFGAYPPGQVFSYSNLGISVLGELVQHLSGQPFEQRLQETVLTPLHMDGAAFSSHSAALPQMAKGYQGGGQPDPDWPLRDVPAGGLNASVKDLARFISMVFAQGQSGGHRVLQPETVAEMLRPQNRDVALDLNFEVGLGWMLSTLGGPSTWEGAGPVAHHAGAIGGFRSQMMLLPKHKLGVVVLANSATATEVVNRIANEALELALEARTGHRQPGPAAGAQPLSAVGAARAQALAGDYTTIAGPLRLLQQGPELKAELAGHRFEVQARTDGLLGLQYRLLGLWRLDLGPLTEIAFDVRQVEGHTLLIGQSGRQQMLLGERLPPAADLGAWKRRLGEYEIVDLGGDPAQLQSLRLLEDHGRLVLEASTTQPKETARRVLAPLSDTQARLLGNLAEGGDMVQVEMTPRGEELRAAGYRLRHK
ncbi:MAG: beta-lactamase family protein [Curvibacter sp.]|nr:beta-lactamase family protein [Curvibacter sp.]